MTHRIPRISPHQAAKVVAVLYALLSLFFIPFLFLATLADPSSEAMPLWLVVFFPLLYAGFGYVFTALACWIYNVVAGWMGGVEITFAPVE